MVFVGFLLYHYCLSHHPPDPERQSNIAEWKDLHLILTSAGCHGISQPWWHWIPDAPMNPMNPMKSAAFFLVKNPWWKIPKYKCPWYLHYAVTPKDAKHGRLWLQELWFWMVVMPIHHHGQKIRPRLTSLKTSNYHGQKIWPRLTSLKRRPLEGPHRGPFRHQGDFIELKRFDPNSEMAQVAARFAPDSAERAGRLRLGRVWFGGRVCCENRPVEQI